MGCTIHDLDPDDRTAVAAVARLHRELITTGIGRLGDRFVERYLYTVLVRDGLLRAALCEVDGAPAGFVAWTTRASSFHRDALRRHWVSSGWILGTSMLRHPSLVRELATLLRVARSRAPGGAGRGEGEGGPGSPECEVLAIGVRPEYRSPAFVRSRRLRLSTALFEHAAERFRAAGADVARVLVEADNTPTLAFYRARHATLGPPSEGAHPLVEVRVPLVGGR
ncbi:MAG: hypothetical protein M5U14_02645 [Acidimicrobiia bacterium]|nr:hypothetical protein [Acidimicrobiia bacterium]